jgi:splicing factor 3B subunit 2
LQVVDQVVIEYVPEKAELEDGMDEFRNIFEKFNLLQSAGSEVKGLVFILFYFLFA